MPFLLPGEHAWATPKDLSTLTVPVLLGTAKKVTPAGLATISSVSCPKDSDDVLASTYWVPRDRETPVAVNQGFIAMVCTQRLPNLLRLVLVSGEPESHQEHSWWFHFAEISKRVFRRYL